MTYLSLNTFSNFTSHNLIVLSNDILTMYLSSLENETDNTLLSCPVKVLIHFNVNYHL
jgi:hypothetical protein